MNIWFFFFFSEYLFSRWDLKIRFVMNKVEMALKENGQIRNRENGKDTENLRYNSDK